MKERYITLQLGNNLLSKMGLFVFFFMFLAQVSFAQKTVSGKVISGEDNSEVPGVNVAIKGTSSGTITDFEGNYSLSVPDGAVLMFSFVGFQPQEVTVGTQSTINVTLMPDIKQLEELVVVGYGVQKKKDLTGSAVKVGEEDFNAGPITSPLQKLTGRAAGVNINQVGSEPGQAPNIRIRGVASLIGGSDPLVVVDGIQGNMDLLQQIPPSEIESIDILKDASATAIYGSRGNAGVIMVTTKKGKEDKMSIEYSGVFSFEMIAKQYELLSASAWRAEAAKRGIPSSADFGGNTDWVKEVTRNGVTQNHNLAFGGGTKNFNYRASLTAINQSGIIIGSGFENYIGRIQATQRGLDDKLTIDFNLNMGVLERQFNNGDRIREAAGRRPTDPIYDKNGNYFIDPLTFSYLNPYARAKEIIDGDKVNSLFGSVRAAYEITEGLTATAFGSWRKTDRLQGQYQSPKTTIEIARNLNGIATRETNGTDERLFNFILNYRKTVGDHSFDASVIYEWQKASYEGFKATGRGFFNDLLTFNDLESADLTKIQAGDIGSYKNDQTLVSFLGRANYSFKDRYLATLTFRRDGSSKFGVNNRWANFPSLSLAWRISEEEFMKGVSIVDDLKLRVGYGITGNQQGLSALGSVRLVKAEGAAFFGGSLIPTYQVSQNANPDLRWETRTMYNAGIDFALMKGKLTGSIDYYYGETSDLLFDYNVPQPPYPFGTIKANVGSMLNTGVEVALNYLVIDKEDFSFTLSGNIAANQTEVSKLSGSINGIPLTSDIVRWGAGGTTGVASTNDGILYLRKGQPLGAFYLFKHAGIENGTQLVGDKNGDGSIENGDFSADRYNVGQALPMFTYAITPSLKYKKFDLNLVLRGVYGNSVYNARKALMSSMASFGQNNVLASAPGLGLNNIVYASDLWLESGSFLRAENFTIGYNAGAFKAIKNVRLSFTANNLFVLTSYTGIDPEVNQSGSNGFGIDFGVYPRTRNFAVGLNLSF